MGKAVLIGVLSAVSGCSLYAYQRGTDLIEWVTPMAHIQWILETIKKYIINSIFNIEFVLIENTIYKCFQ